MERLFVYGTLQRGGRLHSGLKQTGARFISSGQIQGRLYDLGEYPGAVEDGAGASRVHGELYELFKPEEALRKLDRLEGFDPSNLAASLFLRRQMEVLLPDGKTAAAWTYFYNRDISHAQLIASGRDR